jgi:hypothetical protein
MKRMWIVFGVIVVAIYLVALSYILAPDEDSLNLPLKSLRLDDGLRTELNQKIKEAAESDRGILLYYSLVSCPPCRALEEGVFAKPEWQAFAKEKLIIRKHKFPLLGEEPPRQEVIEFQLFAQLDSEGAYPFLAVLRSDGTFVSKMSGYGREGPEYYIEWIERNL